MLNSGGVEEELESTVENVVLLFRISVNCSIESLAYGLLQYVVMKRLIDTMDDTLGSFRLRWSTNHEVYHSLR